jgi:uncharacterized membrane protein
MTTTSSARSSATSSATRTSPSRRELRGRLTTTGLLLLALVPAVAGSVRLVELSGDPVVTADNASYVASPLPVVVHVVGAVVFSVLGAFQLAPWFRRRHLGLHRRAGRVLVPAGLATSLSGLWMTFGYDVPASDSAWLDLFRVVFGTAMTLALVLGVRAVLRRDLRAHRAWMLRGYAIGMGAGTQVLTHLPWVVAAGAPGMTAHVLLMLLGWAVNVAVAEAVIRRGVA